MAATIERLTELLDLREAELLEANDKISRLERELQGSLDGWRREEEWKEDALPLPRLELVYEKRRDWSDYTVTYRLVTRHLLGHMVGHPLSWTRISGGSNREPGQHDLPFRDGSHAAHDRIHLQMPCFKIMPGKAPEILWFDGYDNATKLGKEHRRVGVMHTPHVPGDPCYCRGGTNLRHSDGAVCPASIGQESA